MSSARARTHNDTAPQAEQPISYDINLPYSNASPQERLRIEGNTPYPQYLPTFTPVWFEPLPKFEFTDPALRANPSKANLLSPNVVVSNITPRMGIVLEGINLTKLDDVGKDE